MPHDRPRPRFAPLPLPATATFFDPLEGWDRMNEEDADLDDDLIREVNLALMAPPVKKWENIPTARDELFTSGSEFQPTQRAEIIGIDAVLEEVDNLVHWLGNHKDYEKHGARLEPGVIFEGNPGTGKTLVSRYLATASSAHFLNVRDFPHERPLYTDADIRDLFHRAREHYANTGQPIILFWDEFENAAIERSKGSPDQVATVSQLTAELDGVNGKNEGILLIGCTNYIYGIDQALRRSGRMGLQVEFAAPSRSGKQVLLDYYLGLRTCKADIDTETLSFFFEGDATAADIEEAVMEAWLHAVRRTIKSQDDGTPMLAQADLMKVFIKRLVGPPIANVDLSEDARLRIAIHETGHALVAATSGVPLRLITVQPGKRSLGRVITAEMQDHVATVQEMVEHMKIAAGSVVAERIVGVPAMTGSIGDIEKLNSLAVKLVDRLDAGAATGLLSVNTLVNHRCEDAGLSAELIQRSDRDITDLIYSAEGHANYVLSNIGPEAISAIAEIVNERVTLTGEEFKQVMRDVTGVQDVLEFARA